MVLVVPELILFHFIAYFFFFLGAFTDSDSSSSTESESSGVKASTPINVSKVHT